MTAPAVNVDSRHAKATQVGKIHWGSVKSGHAASVRGRPLMERRGRLADLLKSAPEGIRFSEDFEADGATLFSHTWRLGLESIISKSKARLSLGTIERVGEDEESGLPSIGRSTLCFPCLLPITQRAASDLCG
jgi:hypothetical protein